MVSVSLWEMELRSVKKYFHLNGERKKEKSLLNALNVIIL